MNLESSIGIKHYWQGPSSILDGFMKKLFGAIPTSFVCLKNILFTLPHPGQSVFVI